MENEPNQLPPAGEILSTEVPPVEEEITTEEEEEPVASDSPMQEAPVQRVNPFVLGLTIALVFILGLALGFFGRPVIIEDLPIEVVVTVLPNESQVIAQTASSQSEAVAENDDSSMGQPNGYANGSSGDAETNTPSGQPTPTIMDFVMSDARHVQGDDAAKVTIVEFSDFN